MRDAIRLKNYAYSAEKTYVDWIERYIRYIFRHCFATHLLETGYAGALGTRTVQELLGHKDVKTTPIYTHVLNKGPMGVKSPLD